MQTQSRYQIIREKRKREHKCGRCAKPHTPEWTKVNCHDCHVISAENTKLRRERKKGEKTMSKHTEEWAKDLLKKLGEVQYDEADEGIMLPCPRCGNDCMKPNQMHNALSRHAEVSICSACGMDEAVRDMVKLPKPLLEWSFVQAMVKLGEKEGYHDL